MQIVSDFSSAFPHPRAAALATTTTSTSSISISHSPAIKFHSTNASPFSTLLLASSSSSSTHGKTEDGVVLISVEKLEKSSRRIRSKVGIEASLDAVLTDYEKLSEFIPGLVVSELVEKEGNRVRLFQIESFSSQPCPCISSPVRFDSVLMGQQSIALGLKFNAKAVLDCFEKELEILPHGRRREIDFKMVEGDFQLFEGKCYTKGRLRIYSLKDFPTTLAYTVDVKPKMWLPVRLVEGRLCNEIKTNLLSVRDAAQKVIEGVIHDL
ncbi:hypothetical protein DY000_02010817 [Brassica cretica]|uniref:Coenzyme Q-binding protein COQ10 START domain-containing protein n=1 Tax=Brassica cretica TaxID=69181 RepID=A0ABQ7CSV7_BRACR|nr:hypothetical protein DY000_02010817 [Brassica cretica]